MFKRTDVRMDMCEINDRLFGQGLVGQLDFSRTNFCYIELTHV